MFSKKKEATKENSEPEVVSSNQDLIVHNMPSVSRLGVGLPSAPRANNGGFGLPPVPQKGNFKAVGLVIMIFGLIFIGALIYLSYRFIISPTAKTTSNPLVQSVVTEQKKTATTAAAIIPTLVPTSTVAVATSTPSVISDSAISTSSLMIEELSGQDGSNLPPLLDSDKDGLLDDEEYLLGTSATTTDSDMDTYSDFAELLKNYNPAGVGKLATNVNLTVYNNKTYGYSILTPKDWEVRSLAEDATNIFMAPDDSLIQISIQDNSDKAGILGWYESSFPEASATYDQLMNGDGWDGVMGADNLNFYLTDSKHKYIYVISYIPAVAERIVYPNIFKLMISSLVVK